ncbi:MAG: hypothetical protein EP343_25265 [Deltaproteobacteria bacterium]|nr:MAG: hypothetical protein EP343_25265 [Deltaproteobacteria bacterium]
MTTAKKLLFFILTLALLVAMSRPLAYKKATGKLAEAPKGVQVTQPTIAYFAENTNNQGCFASQKLDTLVIMHLINKTNKNLSVEPSKAQLIHKKKTYSLPTVTYRKSPKAPSQTIRKAAILKPGESGIFTFRIQSYLPKKHLKTTENLSVKVSTSQGWIHCSFTGMKALSTQRGFRMVRFE